MATSPIPGRPGSSTSSPEALSRALAELCLTEPLQTLIAACDDSADLHLVGGTVRDTALGLGGADLDAATVWSPEQVHQALERAGLRVVDTGLRHGTVTAVIDGEHIEITTFREPGGPGYSKTIERDLSGRDFTINAMAFSVRSEKLLDPFGGLDDLQQGILRGVGDPPDRFSEDPLRVMRAVRFGTAQGRVLDPATAAAAQQFAPKLSEVSVERIRVELERILISNHPGAGIRALYELGVLQLVLPEALLSVGFAQNRFHIHDVFEHTLWVLDRAAPDLTVRLAAMFHDLGKPETLTVGADGERHFYRHEIRSAQICVAVMERLKFSNEMVRDVTTLVRYHMRPLDCGPTGARRLLRDLGDNFDRWLLLKDADAPPLVPPDVQQQVVAGFMELIETERKRTTGSVFDALALDGNDLIQLGLKPGPVLGGVLKSLQELVVETPELNTREQLLVEAKKLLLALESSESGA